MPLLDHFHPPVENQFPWDSFHPRGPPGSRTHSTTIG